jgi:hypothetical protein
MTPEENIPIPETVPIPEVEIERQDYASWDRAPFSWEEVFRQFHQI